MALISDSYTEMSEDLIMADDGTGHNINIPSFIIRKGDGDNIKSYLNNGPSSTEQQFVYIKGEIEIIHPANKVEYEIWYSSIYDLDPELVRDLSMF